MLQAQTEPLSDFVLTVYKTNELKDDPIYIQVKGFVDTIKFLTPTKGVENTCQILLDEIFNLRIALLRRKDTLREIFQNMSSIVFSEIAKSSIEYSELSQTKSNALELILKVYSNSQITLAIENASNELARTNQLVPQNFISDLQLQYQTNPTAELQAQLGFFTASLSFEFYLITADLLLSKELVISKTEANVLTQKLYSSIVDLGFILAILKLWTPDEDDDSPLIVKIRQNIQDFEFSTGIRTISREQYYNEIAESQQQIKEGKKTSLKNLLDGL